MSASRPRRRRDSSPLSGALLEIAAKFRGAGDLEGLALLDGRLNGPTIAEVAKLDAAALETLAEPAPGVAFVAAAPHRADRDRAFEMTRARAGDRCPSRRAFVLCAAARRRRAVLNSSLCGAGVFLSERRVFS